MTFSDYLNSFSLIGAAWLFVAVFGCAIFSAIVASGKHRSAFAWFFAGLIFNLVGLIAIAGLPTLDQEAP